MATCLVRRKTVMTAVLARPPRRAVMVDQVPSRTNMARAGGASPGSSGVTQTNCCHEKP